MLQKHTVVIKSNLKLDLIRHRAELCDPNVHKFS